MPASAWRAWCMLHIFNSGRPWMPHLYSEAFSIQNIYLNWDMKTFCYVALMESSLLSLGIWCLCILYFPYCLSFLMPVYFLLIQVYKRLKLTLELVKKEMEISKIQVLHDVVSKTQPFMFLYCYLILMR